MEIKATIIIEMMGRPADHLKGVMDQYLKKLDGEKGISLTKKKIHEPKIVEEKDADGNLVKFEKGKELYSTFAEVELNAETIFDLVKLVFVYMPSNIEIISPQEFRMPNFDLMLILNEIAKKMHEYDAIAKNAIMQNQIFANKLREMHAIIQKYRANDPGVVIQPTEISLGDATEENLKKEKPKKGKAKKGERKKS